MPDETPVYLCTRWGLRCPSLDQERPAYHRRVVAKRVNLCIPRCYPLAVGTTRILNTQGRNIGRFRRKRLNRLLLNRDIIRQQLLVLALLSQGRRGALHCCLLGQGSRTQDKPWQDKLS